MGRTTNFRGRTDSFTFGAYFVDEVAITDWLKIMGGLRFDHFDTSFENKFLRQEFSQINNEFSPRAALIITPTPTQTYYFSYGTSFNPSAEGLALAINTTSAEPEKNESYEIGAKWDLFQRRLALATAFFQIDKTNARTTDPQLGVMINEGKQRVRGFEVSAAGTILPRWNIFTGYTYLDTEVVESLDTRGWRSGQGQGDPERRPAHRDPVDYVGHHGSMAGGRGRRVLEQPVREQHQHHRSAVVRARATSRRRIVRSSRSSCAPTSSTSRTSGTSSRCIRPTRSPAPRAPSCSPGPGASDMLLHLPQVLTEAQVARCRELMERAKWVGRARDRRPPVGEGQAQPPDRRGHARGARDGRDDRARARAQPPVRVGGAAAARLPAAVQPL
jgi:hypothetical protein